MTEDAYTVIATSAVTARSEATKQSRGQLPRPRGFWIAAMTARKNENRGMKCPP